MGQFYSLITHLSGSILHADSHYGQEAAVRANAKALDDAAEKGDAFTQAMAKAADSNWDSAMLLMGQKMDVIRQKIGERLLPVVERMIPVFDKVTDRVFAWIDANPMLVTGIGAVVAGLGAFAAIIAPIALGASALVTTFATLSFGATKLYVGALLLGKKALPFVAKGFLLIARALMANPIGIAIAAIVGAAVLIYRNWEPIAEFFTGLWDRVVNVTQMAWDWIKSLFLNYHPIGLIITHWESVVGFFAGLWDRIKAGIGIAWDAIKELFFSYHPLGLLISHWEGIATTFAGYWDAIKSGISEKWEEIKTALADYSADTLIKQSWQGLSDWFGTLWDGVKTTFTSKWAEIKAEVATWPPKMKSYGADIIQKLIDGIKSKLAALGKAVSDALAKLNPFSNVGVSVNVANEAKASAATPGKSGLSTASQNAALAKQQARLKKMGVPGYARGGTFSPGLMLVGEEGPELRYESRGGFIAHNGLLTGMLSLAMRAREVFASAGGGFDGGMSPVPALAGVAGAGARSLGGAQLTYAPNIQMPPITPAQGVSLEEIQEAMQQMADDLVERGKADVRRMLHDI